MKSETEETPEGRTFQDFVHSQMVAAATLTNQASSVAERYAHLAPAEKPSYLGMFLIIVSLIIEGARSFFYFITFSETMLLVMLVGGLIILVFGSAIDVLMFWVEMKTIRDKEAKLEEQRVNVNSWFRGVRGR